MLWHEMLLQKLLKFKLVFSLYYDFEQYSYTICNYAMVLNINYFH